MEMKVNFEKNWCTSVDTLKAYVMLDMSKVNKSGKIKHIKVILR